MENNTNTQVEKDTFTQVEKRLAWFNASNSISVGVLELNDDPYQHFGDFITTDLLTAIELRNQLNEAINDYLGMVSELNENN